VRSGVPAAAIALLLATRASAQAFPARSGELGIIDVPDAEVAGMARNHLAAELRFDRVAGGPNDFGPLPAYLVIGLTDAIDLGLTMREWGQAGDPRPSRMFFGTAAKLQLLAPSPRIPGVALSAVFDKVNEAPVVGGRVALSTAALPVRLAGFAGFENGTGESGKKGVTAGLAAALPLREGVHLDAEALIGPRGPNYGAALRWSLTANTGVSLGANYLPKDDGMRVALTFAFWPARPKKVAATPESPTAADSPVAQRAPAFKDERPHFRLRMPSAGSGGAALARHLQFGPSVATARGPDRQAAAAEPLKSAAPSLENLAEAQLRDQEALAEARERRVRATSEQIEAAEKAGLEAAKKLEERERELAARERQLDARELRIAAKGPPSQQQRQLESLEAQLASQERNLAAQERSFGPAIDAASGREQEATSRESAERQEASRLAANVSAAPNRAQQFEIRKQALGARNRQLAALEGRLVAKRERMDALERQLRARSERLDAWARRLDTRAERLELLEKHVIEAPPKAAAAPRPAEATPAAPKDKAVFVMVVKSPTAIMKERGASGAGAQGGSPLHAGVAVEKAVAAATVVTFPSPAAALSELDRETIDNIARLAAKESCEILIWARAKDPSLMAEAQRRAADLKARVISSGPLPEKQVVTRITMRPGAQGVDVVVSALRETAKSASPSAAAPATAKLDPGESGKRQIRDAVVTAQASIEACVGWQIERKRRERAEGVLKLSVSAEGRVTKVVTAGEDIAGAEIDECLGRAAASWAFPAAEADYVVDVPITVIRGGAAK